MFAIVLLLRNAKIARIERIRFGGKFLHKFYVKDHFFSIRNIRISNRSKILIDLPINDYHLRSTDQKF